MTTTTLVLERRGDDETAQRVREVLDGETGVARVLTRADRGEVYVRHSAAKAPRHRLLSRLEDEGLAVRVKGR
ncbi:MAG TPA: hypothetical protein VF212_08150 [Longimicrobiales bacterium]